VPHWKSNAVVTFERVDSQTRASSSCRPSGCQRSLSKSSCELASGALGRYLTTRLPNRAFCCAYARFNQSQFQLLPYENRVSEENSAEYHNVETAAKPPPRGCVTVKPRGKRLFRILNYGFANRSVPGDARNYSAAGFGKRISTVVPLPSTLAIEIFPSCASTMALTIARPVPARCECSSGSNGS
jgi:hypothetical protein